jgi:hypothetical protein
MTPLRDDGSVSRRSIRHHYRNGLPSVAPVDAEVAIERNETSAGIELRHAHQAPVGKRHGHAPVLAIEQRHVS